VSVFATLVLAATEEEQKFEAHSPIFPETKEIIFGGAAFLIVAYFLWKFAVPAIKGMLEARTERIQRELDAAAKAETDSEAQAADIRSKLGDIDAERARMLSEADSTAERVLTEGRTRLDEEVAELKERADAEIASAGTRVASELEAEVGTMAGDAAERIVVRQLDDAQVQRLVEDFIASVGNGRKS
jgi:F-type H+-transporting ATPase subunit b